MSKIKIPVTKGTDILEIDADVIPIEVYEYIFALGLKQLVNRGTTKITKALMPDEEARKAEANAIAKQQLEGIYAGKVRMTGGIKVKAASGEVNTEEMRLLRIAVKDTLKAQGLKVSHYTATEITKAAKELGQADPSYHEQAKLNIEARKTAKPVAIDVTKIAVSAKKVADAAAKAKADKEKRAAIKAGKGTDTPISAKQAGKVAPRAVPAKGKGKPAALNA